MNLDIKDIRKGDALCEVYLNVAVRYIALEDGRLDGDEWHCKVEQFGGKTTINLMVHKDYLHYGPRLYAGHEAPYVGIKYLN